MLPSLILSDTVFLAGLLLQRGALLWIYIETGELLGAYLVYSSSVRCFGRISLCSLALGISHEDGQDRW